MIFLSIMRPEPISQQEFSSLVEQTPDLSLSPDDSKVAKGHDFFLYHHRDGNIDVELGYGDSQHPSAGCYAIELGRTRTEQNIMILIGLAEKLNARLWQDNGHRFYRISNGIERYEDRPYWLSASRNSGAHWMTPEQIVVLERREKYERIAVISIFSLLSGTVIYFYGFQGVLIAVIPNIFISKIVGSLFTRDTKIVIGLMCYIIAALMLAAAIIYTVYFLLRDVT